MKILESKLRSIIKQELLEALTDDELRSLGYGKAVTNDERNRNLPRTHWNLRNTVKDRRNQEREQVRNFTSSFISDLSDIQQHNFLSLYREFSYDTIEIKKMVQEIPPLRDKKIKDLMAKGTQGTIYSLEGGSILKLYTGSYLTDIRGENERYSKLKNVSFSGSGSTHDLLVYDNGIFSYGEKSSRLTGWVEMGKLLILRTYFEIICNFNTSEVNNHVKAYDNIYNLIRNWGPTIASRDLNTVEEVYDNYSFISNILEDEKFLQSEQVLGTQLTQRLLKGMLKAYFDNNKSKYTFQDMHIGNVGVLNVNNPIPVFFDL